MIEPPDPATARELARLYDLDVEEGSADLDLYLALADRADGPVLELAAGSGRLAVPLAAAGHRVTAVDVDPAMLARARQRADAAGIGDERLELVEADLLELRAPDPPRHALAFIALNSIMLLAGRDQQRAALRRLAAHVRPGGIVAVDAWLPDAEDLARQHTAGFRGPRPRRHPRVDHVDVEAEVDRIGTVKRLGDRLGDHRLRPALLDLAH